MASSRSGEPGRPDVEFRGVAGKKILDFGPIGRVRRSLYVITTLSVIP
jgi:hypothetical protein